MLLKYPCLTYCSKIHATYIQLKIDISPVFVSIYIDNIIDVTIQGKNVTFVMNSP